MAAVTICNDFGALPPPQKIKSLTVSTSICHEVMEPDAMILVFLMLSFKTAFSLSSFTFIKRLFRSSSLPAISVMSSAYPRYWYMSRQSWFQLVFHPVQHVSGILHILSGISIYLSTFQTFQSHQILLMYISTSSAWEYVKFLSSSKPSIRKPTWTYVQHLSNNLYGK